MSDLHKAVLDPQLADKLWDAQRVVCDMEDNLWHYIVDICGFNDLSNVDDFYFDDITTDQYDRSIEFKNTTTDWVPTSDMLQKIFDYGFSKLWVCYKEGDILERYYNHTGNASQKTRQQGLAGLPIYLENWK